MKIGTKKLLVLAGSSVLAFSANTAHAQSADDSLTVGVDVEVAAAGSVVSGLKDISISFDGTGGSGQIYGNEQQFCVFSPTRFFNLTIQGTAKGPTSTSFYVEDAAQSQTTLKFLRYNFQVADIFSGGNNPIGTGAAGLFQNNVAETGIDGDMFVTDATCSDGPNLELKFSIVLTGDAENDRVVSELVDGQLHSYTDTVTVILEPAV